MGYLQDRLAEIATENEARLKIEAEVAEAIRGFENDPDVPDLNAPKIGYVYFIKSADLVKIGFSADLQQRLAAIKNSNPHELTLLGAMPGTDDTEFFLHQMFAKYRQSGEWFRIEGDLDTFLSCLPDQAKTRKRAPRGSRAGHRNGAQEEGIRL